MNKVILVGRLTADVELKRTANDVPVARFTIAINRSHQKDITDFIDCTAWRGIAEFISKYFVLINTITTQYHIIILLYYNTSFYKKQYLMLF